MSKEKSIPNGIGNTPTSQDEFTTILKRLQGDSQNTKILMHLASGKSITQREAAQEYDIYRLSARIHDLRTAGVSIVTWMEDNEERGQHARYFLEREE